MEQKNTKTLRLCARLQLLSDLKQQNEQQRRTDGLHQHKADEHLRIRPISLATNVIVQRVAHALEDTDFEEAQQRNLDQTCSAVD